MLQRFRNIRLGTLSQYTPMPLAADPVDDPGPTPADLPAFHLALPCLNAATYIRHTLDSIARQNYPKLTVNVRDGGSSDGTEAIVRSHSLSLQWNQSPGQSQTAALEESFSGAGGELMGWINADDLLLPGSLHRVASYFATHPETDVLYGNRICIDAEGREIGRWILPGHDPELLRWVDWIPQETLFWRRSAYTAAGGMDTSFEFAMDWDLLLRLARSGARFAVHPGFLGAFRVHPDQKTRRLLSTVGAREIERLMVREHGPDYPRGMRKTASVRMRRAGRRRAWSHFLSGRLPRAFYC